MAQSRIIQLSKRVYLLLLSLSCTYEQKCSPVKRKRKQQGETKRGIHTTNWKNKGANKLAERPSLLLLKHNKRKSYTKANFSFYLQVVNDGQQVELEAGMHDAQLFEV